MQNKVHYCHGKFLKLMVLNGLHELFNGLTSQKNLFTIYVLNIGQ